MGIVWSLVIGAVAGFLAGKVMVGRGFGLLGNVIVGIIGGLLGGLLFRLLQIETTGPFGQLISATIGAVVLLVIIGAVKKKG